MLFDTVTLWPTGPSVILDDYFVYLKYAFSILLLLWAAGFLRFPSRRWLLGGALFLAVFSWTALDRPLGRPYGVTEDQEGLFELALPMVTAARGAADETWMVRQPSPRPLWSMVLAVVSGFEPGRLLAIYPWVPLASLLFFAFALYWGLGGKSPVGADGGMSQALAVFVALFLCSHRLSILRSPGPLWTFFYWLQPHLGFALGTLFIWIRLLEGARRLTAFLFAGVVFGLLALLEPRLGLCALIGASSWTAFRRRSIGGVGLALALGSALFLIGRGDSWPAGVAEGGHGWYVVFNGLLSLTLDKGLVFYLGCFGLVGLIRRRENRSSLLAFLWVSGFILWAGVSLSARAASILHPELLHGYLQILLAVAAGIGAYRALVWMESKIEKMPQFRLSLPPWIRGRPVQTIGIAAFIALSLPWCFPYWWHALRMDPVYAASVPPISRQFLGLAEWIRSSTSGGSVFVAGPSYAPWISALSGRRVLLVESRARTPEDVSSRRRAMSWFTESNDPGKVEAVAEEWGVTHFAWGRLDQEDAAVDYEFFVSHPLFVERYRLRRWVRVFERQSE